MPHEIQIITMPVADLLIAMRNELQSSKADILKDFIEANGKVKWHQYGNIINQKEAAEIFGKSTSTIKDWISSGILKATEAGGRVIGIPKENVMRLYYNKK